MQLRTLANRLAAYRASLRKYEEPLNLATKILAAHLDNPAEGRILHGEQYLKLRPDRVALQDASAQTAILQFMLAKRDSTAVPTSIHCDHLIVGTEDGRDVDLHRAVENNREVFDFLSSAAQKYGLDFWPPGSGIIHQIVLENYAFPGALIIGCDSHTPNAGGLACLGIGVGGGDAVDVMSDQPWELRAPRILGIHLKGSLSPWVAAKDVILHIAGRLSVRGGDGFIIEYFGDGISALSCTGMATICNMGAELGATTSIFPYTPQHQDYLKAMGRSDVCEAVSKHSDLVTPDVGCSYDDVMEVDLSTLEPHLNGPFSPDAVTPLSKMAEKASLQSWPDIISACLIGSCTNSSYEDLSRCADIIKQAEQASISLRTPLFVTPGSDQIYQTCRRDGILDVFERMGAKILANACGPCIGQWDRSHMDDSEKNTILSSFNRNFAGRNDGNTNTLNFLASPELVTMYAFTGQLSINPCTTALSSDGNFHNGSQVTSNDACSNKTDQLFRFTPPKGLPFSPNGVAAPVRGVIRNSHDLYKRHSIPLKISPSSERLELLSPFERWHGRNFSNLRVLIKVKGRCTTDDISAAGPWLKYKGHLSNISNNTLITAVNADTGERNCVANHLEPGAFAPVPEVARAYRDAGIGWVVIGDFNYGEGSAREHAAMQPRFLGGVAVIARSFARIHETNLKKQGMLPLTFADPGDYDKIPSNALLNIVGFEQGFLPSTLLQLVVANPVSREEIAVVPLKHTFSENQIEWFKAGSALNYVASLQHPQEDITSS